MAAKKKASKTTPVPTPEKEFSVSLRVSCFAKTPLDAAALAYVVVRDAVRSEGDANFGDFVATLKERVYVPGFGMTECPMADSFPSGMVLGRAKVLFDKPKKGAR
jgi:hypothetical protein